MKPKAFTQSLKAGAPKSGYLFVGNELFFRDRCRRALKTAMFGDDAQAAEEGIVEIDLKSESIARLLDETRSLSLFATSRLLIGSNAEGALPKGRSKAGDEAAAQLKSYFKDPTPGVVVMIESTRFDPNERDDKAKIDRLKKFFAGVPETVELDRLSANEALRGAEHLAGRLGLEMDRDALSELVEMLAADMARIESELGKYAVYATEGTPITRADMELLTPEARQRGVFELTAALSRRDQARSLEILDTLAKSGTYWPMQITFLASLFRQALAVKEIGGGNPQSVSAELGRHGIRVWPGRARELIEVARTFSRKELERALGALFEADRDLRRERPEDRLIMERLVLELTA